MLEVLFLFLLPRMKFCGGGMETGGKGKRIVINWFFRNWYLLSLMFEKIMVEPCLSFMCAL